MNIIKKGLITLATLTMGATTALGCNQPPKIAIVEGYGQIENVGYPEEVTSRVIKASDDKGIAEYGFKFYPRSNGTDNHTLRIDVKNQEVVVDGNSHDINGAGLATNDDGCSFAWDTDAENKINYLTANFTADPNVNYEIIFGASAGVQEGLYQVLGYNINGPGKTRLECAVTDTNHVRRGLCLSDIVLGFGAEGEGEGEPGEGEAEGEGEGESGEGEGEGEGECPPYAIEQDAVNSISRPKNKPETGFNEAGVSTFYKIIRSPEGITYEEQPRIKPTAQSPDGQPITEHVILNVEDDYVVVAGEEFGPNAAVYLGSGDEGHTSELDPSQAFTSISGENHCNTTRMKPGVSSATAEGAGLVNVTIYRSLLGPDYQALRSFFESSNAFITE